MEQSPEVAPPSGPGRARVRGVVFLFAVVALFASAVVYLRFNRSPAGIPAKMASYVPASSTFVGQVDFAAIRRAKAVAPLWKEWGQKWRASVAGDGTGEALAKRVDALGRWVFAADDLLELFRGGALLSVLELEAETVESLESLLQSEPAAPFDRAEVRGTPLWQRGELVLGLPRPGLLLVGRRPAVERALAVESGEERPLISGKPLATALGMVPQGAAAWVAGIVPEPVKEQARGLPSSFSALSKALEFACALKVDSGVRVELALRAESADAAQSIQAAVEAAKFSARTFSFAAKEQAPLLQTLLDAVQTQTNGAMFHGAMDLSAQDIQSLASALGQMNKAESP